MADFDRESMMEMFNFEMGQMLDSLEQNVIGGENGFNMDQINEIFRIMHTIKGSAAMMNFQIMASVAHAVEDLFYYLREQNPQGIDYSRLSDHVLAGMDFMKEELAKIQATGLSDGEAGEMIAEIKGFLSELKGEKLPEALPPTAPPSSAPPAPVAEAFSGPSITSYRAVINFQDGCEMENVRAFTLLNNIKDRVTDISSIPEDVVDESSIETIRRDGFIINFATHLSHDAVEDMLLQTVYLKNLDVTVTGSADLSGGDKSCFQAILKFNEGSEMENVRAFTVVHNLKGIIDYIGHEPADLVDESAIDFIREYGLKLTLVTDKSYDEVYDILSETIYLKDLTLIEKKGDKPVATQHAEVPIQAEQPAQAAPVAVSPPVAAAPVAPPAPLPPKAAAAPDAAQGGAPKTTAVPAQTVISVNVNKLDALLKLMGELVIAEAMVTQNPELDGLELESFHKEARQLRKIIKDLQDTVMSMRMVPLSTTFFKMKRIVRDMCKSLGKDVALDIVGEETEVDKNIIEHISDPIMHIIRNSIDHGIELPETRMALRKSEKGTVSLEAKNSGSDVLIIIKDDGQGLDRERIMRKARDNGLLRKAENEYTDKEIWQFIMMAGFSTNEAVTEYSGRGVGMDVVCKNLEQVGGSVIVDSAAGEGSTFTLKIPLTLAIIEGMIIKLAGAKYTIPIVSIRDSFRPKMKDIFTDPNGNEMITVRDEHYNVVRLYEFFGLDGAITNMEDGIMVVVENGDDAVCLLVDELVGEQQVVVKSMPKYIKRIPGISGCTLLGNGDISLIIDVIGFFDK